MEVRAAVGAETDAGKFNDTQTDPQNCKTDAAAVPHPNSGGELLGHVCSVKCKVARCTFGCTDDAELRTTRCHFPIFRVAIFQFFLSSNWSVSLSGCPRIVVVVELRGGLPALPAVAEGAQVVIRPHLAWKDLCGVKLVYSSVLGECSFGSKMVECALQV